jgi:hypothetical protein
MIEDPYAISMVLIYSLFGALVRTLVGIYKSYGRVDIFHLNWRKAAVEFCTSVLVGTFGIVLLKELNVLPWDIKPSALVGGLLGADILNLIIKKVGLTKGLNMIDVNDKYVAMGEFNDREINAINYLKRNEKITKKEYQRLNQTTNDCAKRDLAYLVRNEKLKKIGIGKSTHYELV